MDAREYFRESISGEWTADDDGATFEECSFSHCNWAGADLRRARFLDCKFERCDLSNVRLDDSRWRDVNFVECKLVGIAWPRAEEITRPGFTDCKLDYGNFAGLKLKKSAFVRSSLRDVDFTEAELSEVNFQRTDLLNAQFSRCALGKADFRGALNYRIDPLSNAVKGARFSLPEAQGLLAGLGIVIEDLPERK